jgi:opacity protein-like surface antigen
MKVTRNNKAAATLTLLCGAASLSQASVPLYFPNENSYLSFSLNTGVMYVDNIYAGHIKSDDMMYNITPTVSVETGKDALNYFNFSFSETFVNYLDNSQLDTQLASARLGYTYNPQSRLRLSLGASVDQFAQNDSLIWNPDDDRTEIIRRDYYAANIDASYNLSAKLDLTLGFSYFNEHFNTLRERYNDRQVYTVPLSLHYQLWDRIFVGLSYSYSHTDIERDGNSRSNVSGYNPGSQTSHFAGLSAKGSLSAKLSFRGNVGIGIQTLEDRYTFNGPAHYPLKDDTYSTLNFSLAADYLLSEKSRLSLTSGRNFQIGGRAQNLTSTYARLNATGYLNAFWQFSAYASYTYQDFKFSNGRIDHLFAFGAGLSYLPVAWARIALGYRYLEDNSNRIHNFNVNAVMLSVDLSF